MIETREKRDLIMSILVEIAQKEPEHSIPVDAELEGWRDLHCKSGICDSCSKCVDICPTEALTMLKLYDIPQAAEIKLDDVERKTNRVLIASIIQELMKKVPDHPIHIPKNIEGYGMVEIDPSACVGCYKCVEICPEKILDLKLIYNLPEVFKRFKERRNKD